MSEARWEFRCWPSAPEASRLPSENGYAAEGEDRRTDIYFLIPGRADLLPKLRGRERFEIKTLLDRWDALECWDVSLSSPFPLMGQALSIARACLPDLETGPSSYDTPDGLEQVLACLSQSHAVAKERTRYRRGPLRAEITQVKARHLTAMSIAIECEDRRELSEELCRMGLSRYPNRSYGAALRRTSLP